MLWLVSPQVQGDMVGLKLEYQEYLPKAPVFKALASVYGIIWEMFRRRSLMREGRITGSVCWKWMLACGFSATPSLSFSATTEWPAFSARCPHCDVCACTQGRRPYGLRLALWVTTHFLFPAVLYSGGFITGTQSWLIHTTFNFDSFWENQGLASSWAFPVSPALKKTCRGESTIHPHLATHHCVTSAKETLRPDGYQRLRSSRQGFLRLSSSSKYYQLPRATGEAIQLLGLTSYSPWCFCLVGLGTGLLRLQGWTFHSAKLDSDRSQSHEKSNWHFPGR